MANTMTYQEASDAFEYLDGQLYWKIKASQKNPGDLAGCCMANGYGCVRYNRKLYLTHRIIWLLYHGYWSENMIDHIDRDVKNNRIENLREASPQCNVRNNGPLKNSTTGVKGVSWNKRTQRYEAYIENNGKRKGLGHYRTLAEAATARLEAERANGWTDCDISSSAAIYLRSQKVAA